MIDIDIAQLEAERTAYMIKRDAAVRKLRDLEESYESLQNFRRDVDRSQDDFLSLNQSKNNILSQVEQAQQNCRTAQKYHAGMKNILDGIGTKIIGAVYRALLGSIQLKQRLTMDSINEREDKISYYNKKIKDLDVRIAQARSQNSC